MRHQRRRQNKKKRKEKYIKPLSNYDILDLVVKLRIPHFHGVFMRDKISEKFGPSTQECWIFNHSSSNTRGSHWSAIAISFNTAFYFDSFGKLPPPFEILSLRDQSVLQYKEISELQHQYLRPFVFKIFIRFLEKTHIKHDHRGD